MNRKRYELVHCIHWLRIDTLTIIVYATCICIQLNKAAESEQAFKFQANEMMANKKGKKREIDRWT